MWEFLWTTSLDFVEGIIYFVQNLGTKETEKSVIHKTLQLLTPDPWQAIWGLSVHHLMWKCIHAALEIETPLDSQPNGILKWRGWVRRSIWMPMTLWQWWINSAQRSTVHGGIPTCTDRDRQPFEIHYISGLKKWMPIRSISLPGNRLLIITYIESFFFPLHSSLSNVTFTPIKITLDDNDTST